VLPLEGITVVAVEQAVAAPFATRQLAARNRWRAVGSPAGPVQALLPPVIVAGREPRMDPVPAVGEHTDAILRWLGYDDDQIASLQAESAP